HNGKTGNCFCLHQRKSFKKLVHCAKSPRHYDKCVGIFHKYCFAYKKVLKSDRLVEIRICLLFKRKLDITAHRHSATFKSSAVGCFHYTWSTSRHGCKSH